MAQIEILQEKPLSLVDLQEVLTKVKNRDKELNAKSQKVSEYINKFSKLNLKEKQEIEEKIKTLEINRLSEKHISKIIDIYPEDSDSLKLILAGDNLTLKQEDIKKILECLK
jgi:DNA-directed RNA polymerase subunit F